MHHGFHGKVYGFYGFCATVPLTGKPGVLCMRQGHRIFCRIRMGGKKSIKGVFFVGRGMRWQWALPVRDDDVLNLGAFNTFFSDQAGFMKHSETAVDFFFTTQITGCMALQSDAQ